MSISVSLVMLTWNRWPSVSHSLHTNLASAGYPIRELIHVDNGSDPAFVDTFKKVFKPAVQVLHRENQGVAVGYNRGLALATGSHVVITGCDRIMPENWLKTWVECLTDYPDTGVISCYSQYEAHNHEVARFRGSQWHRDAGARYAIRGALPVEARIHSKEFLFKTGFFREDFGLYGFEDAEWADRADATAKALGFKNYVVEGMFSQHLDCADGQNVGDQTYKEFKREHADDPRRRALYMKCRNLGSPHYNPYARVEKNRL